MNKEQFLRELSDRLKALPESERSIALDYYSELISDRMEDGMTEEEAIVALGSVDQIVREAAPESDRTRVAHRTTTTDGETVTITTPVRSLKADCSCAEISVSSGSLPDGTAGQRQAEGQGGAKPPNPP